MTHIQKIAALERLSHQEKIRHWAKPQPWKIDGKRLRLPGVDPLPIGHILIVDGHIQRMPNLIGRPCFGQPTAYLRNWSRVPYYSHKTKSLLPFRCSLCAVRDACKYVAERRLVATPTISTARDAWEAAGGASALDNTKRVSAATHRWRDLLKALEVHGPFTSTNDGPLEGHYRRLEDEALEKDRLRKHRERKRLLLAAAKQGEFEPELLEAIYRKRDEYVGYHAVAAMHPQAPSFLSCAPDDTRFFDANVLIARKLLGFAGGAVNPNSVSRQLHRLGHYNDRAVNNLRSRVAASMVRLDRMHKMNLPGEKDPIFPPLNVAQIIKGLKPPPTD